LRLRRLPYGRGTILDNVLQTNIELYSEEEKKQISDIRNQDRFVPYSERAKEIGVKSQIEMKTYIMGQGIHKSMTWKGIPVYKTTYDFTLYSMMIWDIKPKTIIEIGSAEGGTAVWMGDLCQSYGLNDTMIYSMDLHVPRKSTEKVRFLKGDSNKIEELWNKPEILPHPWLIIEDSHININGIVKHFEKYMQPKDYLVVEDTRSQNGINLKSNLMVDTYYCDYFGRNATCCINSILCKI
tara:strand:- start:2165 stop:2881 length:717 start_codon:yes stop_codon:yes gene_type:complete